MAGRGCRCRPLVLALVGAACAALLHTAATFVHGGARSALAAACRRTPGAGAVSLHALEGYTEMSASGGISSFQGSQASLWTAFIIVALCVPGVVSTINRTGQAKYVEKAYAMQGPASGGLEMRSIAGGIVSYFKSLNYTMQDSPQKGKIRFVGNLQGSVSQALYLTSVLFGGLFSVGIVLQAFFPGGPFDFGPNFWFVPCVLSPGAGWYYWGRAFRRDIVEMELEMSDDATMTNLTVLGNAETIEGLQTGVRFMAPDGSLLQLMEQGMEYQEGILENIMPQPSVYVEKEGKVKAAA